MSPSWTRLTDIALFVLQHCAYTLRYVQEYFDEERRYAVSSPTSASTGYAAPPPSPPPPPPSASASASSASTGRTSWSASKVSWPEPPVPPTASSSASPVVEPEVIAPSEGEQGSCCVQQPDGIWCQGNRIASGSVW